MKRPTSNFKNLLEILNFERKKELEKACKSLIIYQQDFVSLILAA